MFRLVCSSLFCVLESLTEMSAIPGHYWITDRALFNQFMPTKDYKDLRVLYIGWTIFHRLNIMISQSCDTQYSFQFIYLYLNIALVQTINIHIYAAHCFDPETSWNLCFFTDLTSSSHSHAILSINLYCTNYKSTHLWWWLRWFQKRHEIYENGVLMLAEERSCPNSEITCEGRFQREVPMSG